MNYQFCLVLTLVTLVTSSDVKIESNSTKASEIKASDGLKTVCYFTDWAVYRPSPWTFRVEDIDPKLCTHISYAFTKLENNRITVFDPNADTDQYKFYEKVVALKSQGIVPIIAIGGWTDSAGTKYGTMLSTPQNRATFIDSVLKFLDQYGFQGLDLDYEYPTCPQNDCNDQSKGERSNFSKLVSELRNAFDKKSKSMGQKLWLTAAVSANLNIINNMYEIPELSKYLDFINLMAYDLSGAWEPKAGHHSTLYPCGPNDVLTVNGAVQGWLKSGMDSQKIILGVPMYGRSLKLSTSDVNYGAPISGPASAGKYTREAGFWSLYEICNKVKSEGFSVQRSDRCPYAYNANVREWVSYDGPESVKVKAAYIRNQNLGGAMVWTLDLDDFRGDCCNVKYPLLGTLNAQLRGVSGYENVNCGNLK